MLARQCGRHGRAAPLLTAVVRLRCPPRATLLLSALPASVWITEDFLRRAFQSFFARSLSSSQPRCEFNSEDYSRRLLRRRMSMTRAEAATRHDQMEAMGCNKWNEAPPTFSWSMARTDAVLNGSLRISIYPANAVSHH